MIDTPIIGAHLLAGDTERILVRHHIKSEVVVPQIMVKSIIRSDDQKPLELCVDVLDQRWLRAGLLLKAAENLPKLVQDTLPVQISI